MLVHSGSGLHGHEYSPPLQPRSTSILRRSPLTRSSFSTPITPSSSTYDRPIPSIRHSERPISEYIPRLTENSVRFLEQESDTMSDDGRSVANSDFSGTTTGGKRRKRSIRTSSVYHLAHPAPTLTQKQRLLQIRPKLLFQLQHCSIPGSRPKPVVDVLPSTVVAPRLIKKFPRMFRGKGELGANDVMVVKSEEYETEDDDPTLKDGSDTDEDGLSNRALLAVVCQVRKAEGGSLGKAEIVLDDGIVWSATPVNGLFEFVSEDENGVTTIARWVKRTTKRKSVDFSQATEDPNDTKFTFSIVNPNSRRHPILASLTPKVLDIPDYYASSLSLPSSQTNSGDREDEFPVDAKPTTERKTIAVDDKLRVLIQVTGIWVALRQGWSSYFKYNDSMTAPSVSSRSRVASGLRTKSFPMSPDGAQGDIGSTTPESIQSTFAGVGEKIRKTCTKGPNSTSSPSSLFEKPSTTPKRAVSTGTAFMQRAAARRGNPPSTVLSESESDGMGLPKRATTGDFDAGHTPLFLNEGASPATTIDTPTRRQRLVQSVYAPTSTWKEPILKPQRYSEEFSDKVIAKLNVKQKGSRWKAFARFFRRPGGNRTG